MNILKFKLLAFIILLFIIASSRNLYSCTIFYLAGDSLILAGNNEDWKDPSPIMWFFPAEYGKHGWVKFGWGSGFPQGGINDQGLFWDATAGPYLAMPNAESNKQLYVGPIMQKVIEECASVSEARTIFSSYYCEDLYRAQYLIGDAGNGAMIVEGDTILQMSGDHMILTNFIHSHPELGGYPCSRYETATEMLEAGGPCTPYLIGAILEATHQEGKYPTQYSQIYDLKSQSFYLFYYHNYEEFIYIDLNDELNKGKRNYSIPALFAGIDLLTPEPGDACSETSIEFTWTGRSDFYYELWYSTDPGFPAGKSSSISCLNNSNPEASPPVYGIALFLFLILILNRPKKLFPVGVFLWLAVWLVSCSKENPSEEDESIVWTQTVTDLQPGSTYYWKIKAHPIESEDFWSETVVRSFFLEQ